MPNAENAKLDFEAGQNAVAMSALSDSGDNITFTSGNAPWSLRDGYAPDVRPDGLITGGAVTPGTGNDAVNVAALTAYLAGVLEVVSAAPGETVLRGETTNTNRINSITVTSAGAVAVVSGKAHTAFSEVRGALGAPPYIQVGSIEVAQVRLTSITAAPVAATEIFAVVGVHTERYDFPLWEDVSRTAGDGQVEFLSALPTTHTGDATKGVFASYATPIFAQVSLADDFTPPETTHSVSSTQIYGATLASKSSTLGQGSFTAYLSDGVTDPLVALRNEELWFRFYPNRFKTAHLMCQGKLGVSRSFPAGDNIAAECTISASAEAVGVAI